LPVRTGHPLHPLLDHPDRHKIHVLGCQHRLRLPGTKPAANVNYLPHVPAETLDMVLDPQPARPAKQVSSNVPVLQAGVATASDAVAGVIAERALGKGAHAMPLLRIIVAPAVVYSPTVPAT
jgi:hypothetical protein